MAKITLEFDTQSAAFDDYGLRVEIKRVLGQAADKIMAQFARAPGCVCDAPESDDKLLDTNGNTVGRVSVHLSDEDMADLVDDEEEDEDEDDEEDEESSSFSSSSEVPGGVLRFVVVTENMYREGLSDRQLKKLLGRQTDAFYAALPHIPGVSPGDAADVKWLGFDGVWRETGKWRAYARKDTYAVLYVGPMQDGNGDGACVHLMACLGASGELEANPKWDQHYWAWSETLYRLTWGPGV